MGILHDGTPDKRQGLALVDLARHVQSGDATGYQVWLMRQGRDALADLRDNPCARNRARAYWLFGAHGGVTTWRKSWRCNCGTLWATGDGADHTSEGYGTDRARPCRPMGR